MTPKGLQMLDDFLLNCGEISQEEREEIMEFVNAVKDGFVEVLKHN